MKLERMLPPGVFAKSVFTVALCVAVLLLLSTFATFSDGTVKAQVDSSDARLPDGGGEFKFLPGDEITAAERKSIQVEIDKNVARLRREGRLEPTSPEVVQFQPPLAKAPGVTDFQIFGISNYVDHNPVFPNQLRDWNCGTRTYDQSSGYNHQGIDMFTWPFGWLKMDNSQVFVVAAAAGTIVNKSDGNPDRSCGFGAGQWNAVYVQHSDGSIAWYGHMKNGSTTPKTVGQTVAAGEYLGVVGSSGNSTGPHLHFELYAAGNQLRDPFQGPCNLLNSESWWTAQEAYRVSGVNKLMTGSAGPIFPACPNQEVTSEKTVFNPGDTLVTSLYYRDQLTGHQTQHSILRPDGSTFSSWTQTSPDTYNASYWWWSWTLPTNAPGGQWKFRAVYQSTTYETTFQVNGATPTPTSTPTNTPTATPTPAPSGMEGDVSTRPSGDGNLTSTDVVQVRRYVAGLDTPAVTPNEFQRTDASPLAPKGDGVINAADVVQTRRFVAGLDTAGTAGGPTSPIAPDPFSRIVDNLSDYFWGSEILVGAARADDGGTVTVPVEIKLRGDETAVSFTIEYDQTELLQPTVTLGDAFGADAVLTTNYTGDGRIGIVVDSSMPVGASKNNKAIVLLRFEILAIEKPLKVTLSGALVPMCLSDSFGNKLAARWL